MKYAVETTALTCRYGKQEAVHELNLAIPKGSIFALLGPNGAGKTTTIKMLMNLIIPTSGVASTLGCDTRKLGTTQLQRIGYVSENQKLPEWMTVRQLIDYCKPFYPDWDDTFCELLKKKFNLPEDRKISHLSRGMKSQAALLIALAFHPELLVLDEPFSGLDPMVRDSFISGILELSSHRPWTTLLSSHDIEEVERLADWVGIIHEGKLILSEPLETLLRKFRRIEFNIVSAPHGNTSTPSYWQLFETSNQIIRFVHTDYSYGESEAEIFTHYPDAKNIDAREMTLREIFIVLSQIHSITA